MKIIATGHEAIALKNSDDSVSLNKYADPIEDAREDISSEDAEEIAKEDESLIYATKYSSSDIALEKALSEAANEEGTIQAGSMQKIAPHHRPELHTTMSVSRAFEAITGKSYDADFFCN